MKVYVSVISIGSFVRRYLRKKCEGSYTTDLNWRVLKLLSLSNI